jgi:hypothetical protein
MAKAKCIKRLRVNMRAGAGNAEASLSSAKIGVARWRLAAKQRRHHHGVAARNRAARASGSSNETAHRGKNMVTAMKMAASA